MYSRYTGRLDLRGRRIILRSIDGSSPSSRPLPSSRGTATMRFIGRSLSPTRFTFPETRSIRKCLIIRWHSRQRGRWRFRSLPFNLGIPPRSCSLGSEEGAVRGGSRGVRAGVSQSITPRSFLRNYDRETLGIGCRCSASPQSSSCSAREANCLGSWAFKGDELRLRQGQTPDFAGYAYAGLYVGFYSNELFIAYILIACSVLVLDNG